jgi:hypothetical protein
MRNVELEFKNYQRKIRNQTQEIETYRYQNRLLQDQISNLQKTIDSFKKVHASKTDLTDSLHQEVLQEELSHKIKENCELHSKLEHVCKDFHDKENSYLNQIDELKRVSKNGGGLRITSGGDVEKNTQKTEDFDNKNTQKTITVPDLKFDYKHFNFCLSLILPSLKKEELNFKLEYFKPGYFTYILTQHKTSANKSILEIITKSIDNCSLVTDYLNDRQRQVAHNDNQNDAVVEALNQNEIISSLLNSLSKSKNLCEISEVLDRLSLSVGEFVSNIAALENEDFCLGIGGAGDWKQSMKRLVQIKLGLRHVSTSLSEYCSILNTRGVLKSSDVFVKPVKPEMVKTEEEVEHEIKLQFEDAVSEKFDRIVAETVNFEKTGFEFDADMDTFLIQAEKMFWEQEANSLAARLAWESAQRTELLQKFSENDLQNKTMKEEMKQLKTEFEAKILQNNETMCILSEKADSFTKPMQSSTSINPFTSATNAVKNTFSKVQSSATKRPVLLSKIFK